MTESSLTWRKSTYSSSSGTCVEVAASPEGRVLVRNSNRPDGGTLALAPGALAAWAAELDGLVAAG